MDRKLLVAENKNRKRDGDGDVLLAGGEEVPKADPGIVARASLVLEKARLLLPKSVRLRQQGFFIPPKKKPQKHFLTLTDAMREMGSGKRIILN